MICKKCGSPIDKTSSVCTFCGEPVPDHTTFKLLACVVLVGLILFLLVWYSGFTPSASNSEEVLPSAAPAFTDVPSSRPEPELPDPRGSEFLSGLSAKKAEEYILRGFSSGLTETDLASLSRDDLLLLRCGMYAISGLTFREGSSPASFFGSFSWYSPNTDDPDLVRQRFNLSQSGSILQIESRLKNMES